MLDISVANFTEILRINLIGPFLAIQNAAPHMIRQGGGSIVCTASVAGLRANAGGVAYSASKAGVISLVQTAANALIGTGVRVNAICPGLIETGMTKPMFDQARAKGTDGKIGQLNALQRAGSAARDRGDGAVSGERRELLRQWPGVSGRRRIVEHASVRAAAEVIGSPLPACGERVGVRGRVEQSRRPTDPRPPHSGRRPPSPRKRGEGRTPQYPRSLAIRSP